MTLFAHYHLTVDGGLDAAPPATNGECFPYIRMRDGEPVLHVIEGGSFHSFRIGRTAVGRLIVEGGEMFWREAGPK